MAGSKREMPGRMPVLGQHAVSETVAQRVDDRHHRIALGHGQRAARTEVVLYVHHHQAIPVVVGHGALALGAVKHKLSGGR